MAKCEFCDKGVTFGIKVSHSHRRSNRPWSHACFLSMPPSHFWIPAMFLASFFFSWIFPWRAIMMRWAWGEPAPCMDSVR